MNIEELLEQYFEGRTSAEEEATLRRFFASVDVPENLKMYKPLFTYFDDEIKLMEVANGNSMSESRGNILPENDVKSLPENKNLRIKTSRKLVLWISGAAACAAIITGTFLFESQSKKCPGEGDYDNN